MVETGQCKRAGLLATQGVRGGANRETLKRIKTTGDIFFAESDREWVLDGANVHISMVGFDGGGETARDLDGRPVGTINADLTAAADVTLAKRMTANSGLSFMGDTKGGPFDIPFEKAQEFLHTPNVSGKPSSDVVVPWCNGLDVTRRNRDMWIVDFGVNMSGKEAALYEGPFELTRANLYAVRQTNKRKAYKERWWIHAEARPAMGDSLGKLDRFIAMPRVAKHLLFVWMKSPTLPDCQLIVFARSDDYFFGVLHSRIHQVWGLKLGTRLETRPRYTPTSCFETFPFPDATDGQRTVIGEAAQELDRLRGQWLNPPEWTRTETLEFPGSVSGPWGRYVHDPDERGVGTVRFPRLVPKDAECASKLAERTLTNLYNLRPAWLEQTHRDLDEAVSAAYDWKAAMSDEDIIDSLLELNVGAPWRESAPASAVTRPVPPA